MISSFRGAAAHYFLINNLLLPISKQYSEKNKPLGYIFELIELNVEYLLEVRNKNTRDVEAVNNFVKFLKTYLTDNRRSIKMKLETFKQVNVSSYYQQL